MTINTSMAFQLATAATRQMAMVACNHTAMAWDTSICTDLHGTMAPCSPWVKTSSPCVKDISRRAALASPWIQMCRLMLEARMVMHHENTMNNHNMTKIWCMTWCNERPQAEPNTGCIFLLNRDPGSSCSQVAPLLLFHRASAWQADSPGYSWGDDETTNGKVVCMADTRIQSLEKVKTSQNKELVRIWQSLQFRALSQILFSLQSVARLPFPEPCPSIWCTPGMVKKAETTKPTTSDLKSSKSGRLPHPPVRFQCSQVSAWLKPARICNEGWIS